MSVTITSKNKPPTWTIIPYPSKGIQGFIDINHLHKYVDVAGIKPNHNDDNKNIPTVEMMVK